MSSVHLLQMRSRRFVRCQQRGSHGADTYYLACASFAPICSLNRYESLTLKLIASCNKKNHSCHNRTWLLLPNSRVSSTEVNTCIFLLMDFKQENLSTIRLIGWQFQISVITGIWNGDIHMCMWFIILIPVSRCQHTCSTTHQNHCEPAIIFFLQALSWPRAYSTGSLLYQLTPPPATVATAAATAASITELHSWLQIINTERSGHFRTGSTRLRGEDHTQQRQDIDCRSPAIRETPHSRVYLWHYVANTIGCSGVQSGGVMDSLG